MIRLITLDVNNTLLRFRLSPAEEYARVAALHGVTAPKQALTVAIEHAVKQQTRESPVFGSGAVGGWQTWWRRVVELTFTESGVSCTKRQVDAIAQDLICYYSTAPAYSVLPHAPELLQLLSQNDIAVGVITNTDPRIKQVLHEHGFSKHFRFVLDAYSVGFIKPHPEIFKRALAEAGLKELSSQEVLHIGDSLAKDFIGARDAGWRAWLVAPDFDSQCAQLGVQVEPKVMFSNLQTLLPALRNVT